MNNILVFGATGGTGKEVVKQSLDAGYKVTAIIRNPEDFITQHPNLVTIKGDVLQPESFEAAVKDKDAVISCVGIKKQEPTTIYSEGVANILKAMEKHGVKRIICLSAAAVVVPPKASFVSKLIARYILQKIFKYSFADMLKMEKMFRETHGFNWTVIRPPRLLDTSAKGKYRVTINEPIDHPGSISRADLAGYILGHLEDERIFGGLVEISE